MMRDVVGQERARVARGHRRAAAWRRPGATARGDFARITFLHLSTIQSTTSTSLRLPTYHNWASLYNSSDTFHNFLRSIFSYLQMTCSSKYNYLW